jgi:hypothetical protein
VYLIFDAYTKLKLAGQPTTSLYLITKVKNFVQHTMKAEGSKVIALLCPNHGARLCGWSTPRSDCFTPVKSPGTHWRRLNGHQGQSGRGLVKRNPLTPTRDRNPDRPFCSEALHRPLLTKIYFSNSWDIFLRVSPGLPHKNNSMLMLLTMKKKYGRVDCKFHHSATI